MYRRLDARMNARMGVWMDRLLPSTHVHVYTSGLKTIEILRNSERPGIPLRELQRNCGNFRHKREDNLLTLVAKHEGSDFGIDQA